jgi:DNA-directed RNA polymerase specialized sigma24 family protein
MSDNEILALSYKNPSRFAELFDRHHGRLLAIAKSALDSRDEAEDVVQEAFVRIYKYSGKFLEQGGDFKHWSNGILRNLIIDAIRKRQKHEMRLTEEMEEVLAAPEQTEVNLHHFASEILNLRFVLGHSFKEIGRMLGISSGAARVKTLRAKKEFLKQYGKQQQYKH